MLRNISNIITDYELPEHVITNLSREYTFNKGLNIIVGGNGSGKSHLIKVIKKYYGINEYDTYSNPKAIKTLNDFDNIKHPYPKLKATIDKDNEVAIYCNEFFFPPENKMIMSNQVSIMDIASNFEKNELSSGQHKMAAQNILLKFIENKSWYNDKDFDKAYPLLIMDEPTLGMEPEAEAMFFKYMKDWGTQFQIVIATNSPFALLNLRGVNYIEVEEGVVEKRISWLRGLIERI